MVRKGRFGPYAQHGQFVATLPRGTDMDAVTLDEAVALLADKGKPLKAKAGAKKAPAKKKAAAKTTTAKTATKAPAKTAAKATTKSATKTTKAKAATATEGDAAPAKPKARKATTTPRKKKAE